MKTSNTEVARVLDLIADLLEVRGGEDAPKAMAYRRASRSVEGYPEEIEVLCREGRLREIPGVGEALAKKIGELVDTGRLGYYERLAAEVPPGVLEMLRVPGVGVKTAGLVWRELGLAGVDQLEQAARSGALRRLPGLGPKKEAAILRALAAFRRGSDRYPLGLALPAGLALTEEVSRLPGVRKAALAGSARRWRDTVGDLNLVAATSDPEATAEAFAGLPGVTVVKPDGAGGAGEPGGADVEETNPTAAAGRIAALLHPGFRVDLRLVAPEVFGGALRHFTGSTEHNRCLAEKAASRGLVLDERGLSREGKVLPAAGEEEIFGQLGLPLIPPELREGGREIEAAEAGGLPPLVEVGDIRGDLHVHTDWSDGTASLEAMAEAGRALGYEYVAVTDHTKALAVTRGLDEKRLLEQKDAIEALNAKLEGEGFRLLAGTEVEILANGELDLPDSVLAELDIVTASLHTGLRQPPERTTARLLAALKNEHVDVIGHPSGRLIGRREPSGLDLEAVLEEAARRGTLLEINASPERLDLKDADARRAKEKGCKLVISTDAHHPRNLGDIVYGVATARRAWLGPQDIANTRPWKELKKLLPR